MEHLSVAPDLNPQTYHLVRKLCWDKHDNKEEKSFITLTPGKAGNNYREVRFFQMKGSIEEIVDFDIQP